MHLLLGGAPPFALHRLGKLVKLVKGYAAQVLGVEFVEFVEFPALKPRLPSVPSRCTTRSWVATVGAVPRESLTRYLEGHKGR